MNPRNQFDIENLIDRYITRIFYRNDGRFMAAFGERIIMDPNHSKHNLEEKRNIGYYLLDDEGRILPDKLFELKDTKYLTATVRGEFKFASYPFLAKSMIARFTWPRDKPIVEVKNGFIYTRETNCNCDAG